MLEKYNSILNYFGADLPNSEISLASEELDTCSISDLVQLKQHIEARLFEHRAAEPSRKQNKTTYKLWVQETHDYLDFLKMLQDKISEKGL